MEKNYFSLKSTDIFQFIFYLCYGLLFINLNDDQIFYLLVITLSVYLLGKFLLIFNKKLLINYRNNRYNANDGYSPLLFISIAEIVIIPIVSSQFFDMTPEQMRIYVLVWFVLLAGINGLIGLRTTRVKENIGKKEKKYFEKFGLYTIYFSELFAISYMYKWSAFSNESYQNGQLPFINSIVVSGLMAIIIFFIYLTFYWYRANLTDNVEENFNIKKKALIMGINVLAITITGISLF
jgi:hypothetical protein